MNIPPQQTFEQLSRCRRLSRCMRWVALALGMLMLGLYLHELSGYYRLGVFAPAQGWFYFIEGFVLLLILTALFLNGLVDRRRASLENQLDPGTGTLEGAKGYGGAMNIHAHRVNEKKAQELAERLTTTLESITDAFFTLDREWCFTYVNREAERLLKRNRFELLHSSLWECFPEALGSEFEAHYRKAVATGNKVAFEAYYKPIKLWVSVNAYPSADGLSVYFQDVTERKRAEGERARIRELEQSRELAELESQTKSSFLASMSHEIRTPINGIVGMVDALRQTSLGADQVEMVDIVRDSAHSLVGIVDDILDFSKIEAGKLELHVTAFSPAAVMRSVCLLLDRMACNQDVELTLYTDPTLPDMVLGDELRLRQVLLNLINNAIKFSANQGRRGRVKVHALVLPPLPGVEDGAVRIEWRVLDNGVGMTSATLSRLFNPFVQADASTTRQYGGTGLGLSISSNLVELMGGDIKVASELGNGTEFRVRLALPVSNEAIDGGAMPDLMGYSVIIWPPSVEVNIREEIGLSEALMAYLHSAGARVHTPEDLHKSDVRLSQPWLALLDGGDDNPSEADLMSRIPVERHAGARWLVLGRGYRRKARRESDRIFRIDANSLSQINFLESARLALGLVPEDNAREEGGRTWSVTPPSREKVLAEGRLVLVAEDNETNRQVIVRQLGLMGYGADLTTNGRDALKRWRQNPRQYAAVLTDLHMPEMDGYELTQAIRKEERQDWDSQAVPIIALTANALAGESARCRDSGMDDYLVKPVSIEGLRTSLEHWCSPRTEVAGYPVPAQGKRDMVEPTAIGAEQVIHPVLDLQILRNLVGEEQAVVADFVQSFWNSSERLSAQLSHAARQRDWTTVSDIAHSLKSSSRSVGALALGECCAQLEHAARSCVEQPPAEQEKYMTDAEEHLMGTGKPTDVEQSIHTWLRAFDKEWRSVQQALKATIDPSPL